MKYQIRDLLLLSLLGFATCVVNAREYHVSPSGSDSNNGSTSSPSRTISKATRIVLPNDTITIHEDTQQGSPHLRPVYGKAY